MGSRVSVKTIQQASYIIVTDGILSPKIRNTAKLSTSGTSIQWCLKETTSSKKLKIYILYSSFISNPTALETWAGIKNILI